MQVRSFFGFVHELSTALINEQKNGPKEVLSVRLQGIVGQGCDFCFKSDLTNGKKSNRYPLNQREGLILRDAVIAITKKDMSNMSFFAAYFDGIEPMTNVAEEAQYRLKLFTLATSSQLLKHKKHDYKELYDAVRLYAGELNNSVINQNFKKFCPEQQTFESIIGRSFIKWFYQMGSSKPTSLTLNPTQDFQKKTTHLEVDMFSDKTHKFVFSDREYEKEKKRFSGFLQLPSPNYIPFDPKDAKSWILAPTLQHTAVIIDKKHPYCGNVAATQNVCECVNVSFHNTQTQKAGQAHFDIYTNISSIFPASKEVQGESLKDIVTITMTSSYMSKRFSDIYFWIKKQGFNVNYVDISYDQTGKVGNNQNAFFMRTTKNYFEFIYPYHYYSQYIQGNGKHSPQPLHTHKS